MKRILLILSSERFSGGEKVALDIAKNLKNNIKFSFFLPQKPQGKIKKELENFDYFYPKKSNFFSAISKLASLIKERKFDVFHSHGIKAGLYVKLAILLSFKKVNHIYTLHGIHFVHYNFLRRLLFLFFEIISNRFLVDILTCVSKDDFNLAKRLKLISGRKIFLIENGIDIDKYNNFYGEEIKKVLDFENKTVIASICRLHYQKDVRTLIKAIKLLERENIILLIVGDGPDKEKLRDLVSKLKLQTKVLFLNFVEDVRKILSAIDIFVLSTKWEGLPIVILEAWAMKKPVIASAVHGVKGLIKDRENGILFKFADFFDLKNKILLLIKDKDLRFKIVNGGFKLVKEKHNLAKMLDGYKKIYQIL